MHRQFCLLRHGIMIFLPPPSPSPLGKGSFLLFYRRLNPGIPRLGSEGKKKGRSRHEP